MLGRLGSAVVFVAGSVAGGLALAFLIVALRPDLIRNVTRVPPPAQPAAADPAASAPARVSYADAVQRAAPAVVNIYTARLVTERLAPSLGELFGEYMPRYRQRIERSLGSGVIVDAAGHIVTNHHVIANADSVRVQLADGRIADAHIVGRDPDTDLAVLKIDLAALPVAEFGCSDLLKVGDVVLAIGNPVGLSQTVTHGIVSATSRQQLGIAPLESIKAPPELPKLIGASVWMKSSSGAMPSCWRLTALTMPWVTVWDRPIGSPMASTTSPTRKRSERPKVATGSGVRSILSTARSVSGSRPTMRASATRPSSSCTRIESALAMTW